MWEPADVTRSPRCKWLSVAFHRPRSPVCHSEFALRVLVSQHLCDVVFSGATGAPDLCSSGTADPAADRWLSMVTSTVDATVTLLKDRILSFLTVLTTAPVE